MNMKIFVLVVDKKLNKNMGIKKLNQIAKELLLEQQYRVYLSYSKQMLNNPTLTIKNIETILGNYLFEFLDEQEKEIYIPR